MRMDDVTNTKVKSEGSRTTWPDRKTEKKHKLAKCTSQISVRGSKRGVGGPSYHQNTRNRDGSRCHHTLNALCRTSMLGIKKSRAVEVIQQNPEWIVNALDCSQQIQRYQGIELTSVPPEMRAAITSAITATVHHCKTLPITATEGQNPLGRRTPDDQTR